MADETATANQTSVLAEHDCPGEGIAPLVVFENQFQERACCGRCAVCFESHKTCDIGMAHQRKYRRFIVGRERTQAQAFGLERRDGQDRIHRRLISEATYPAPNPLSMLTTLTLEAQEFIMPNSAARPLKDA